MLSKTTYAALCVLGTEIFYAVCLAYGFALSAEGKELHHALFELIPGFMWGNLLSVVWGAVYMAILAWLVGCYIAWMHRFLRFAIRLLPIHPRYRLTAGYKPIHSGWFNFYCGRPRSYSH